MERLHTTEPEDDPGLQRRIVEARARQRQLLGRERTTELVSAIAFICVAVPLAFVLPGGRLLDPALAVALVALYALAARVEFHVGSGWTVPTQLVFVPMLFLLPASAVPLLVVAGLLLCKLPEYVSREVHPYRAVLALGDGWYAVGPALILGLTAATTPEWSDWPIYLMALAAQFGFDLVTSVARECLGYGLRLRELLRELRPIFIVDALLSPIGLLAAFASAGQPWASLLVFPLVGLIAIFARERDARIDSALTLSSAYRGTAHLLAEVLSASHEYTGRHSRSVIMLAHQVGVAMRLDDELLREIEFGALLHDIGKLSMPLEVLNKPGALNDEEWDLMRTHTLEGERMLERIGGMLEDVGHVIRSHHERFDGTGYPDGLRGEEIPIAARVIACCDAFHAMTTTRPYREALPLDAALDEMRSNAGTQFDPAVVEVLVTIVEGRSEQRAVGGRNGGGAEATRALEGVAAP